MRETETAAPAAVPVAGNDNRADIGDGKGGLFFSGQFRLCSVQSFGSSYIPLSSGICPLEARLVMVISIAPMLKMMVFSWDKTTSDHNQNGLEDSRKRCNDQGYTLRSSRQRPFLYQYGPKSCFHKNKADFGIKIPMAVFVLILCNHDFMH
ncbi:hypothetical protein HanRHA438_Chr13g0604541 [Helianthus annuus]|uniref:uncharacterized protein LOC110903122 isoform X2 n=1 Tax=Helianthus annuus TaxID=4232 RepID=UPI000B8F6131|nr:uncharacterized protein LOC110903122 isoform X2 [Helianthus annuus]KAJ0858742.1 hypothetical protein HanRHA438_Chr13g0604541 [Helianthus annuus]